MAQDNTLERKKRYEEICQKEKICIFLLPFWMNAVCGENEWDVIIDEKDGVPRGVLVYAFQRINGKVRIIQPIFTQSNGVWLFYPENQKYERRLAYERDVMTNLIKKLEEKDILSYQQCFNVNVTNWLPFFWEGYSQTTYYSYRIMDISSPENVFQNFSSSKKRNIKHARKLGVQIEEGGMPEEFYLLHKENLENAGDKISYSYEQFRQIYDAVIENEVGQILRASDEKGVVKAALFCVWDEECAFNLIYTIKPEFRSSGALTLLVYEMIKRLSGKVKSFDMEGSMIESVEKSYSQFGTEQLPYFKVDKKFVTSAELILYKVLNKIKRK